LNWLTTQNCHAQKAKRFRSANPNGQYLFGLISLFDGTNKELKTNNELIYPNGHTGRSDS